jgi:uncharacterized membrane protein YphA (DoxX/SURF4 family)
VASPTEDVVAPVQSSNHAVARLVSRAMAVGCATYAAAVAGLGVLLLSSTFLPIWVPLPLWVPGRLVLACAVGALMVIAAVGVFWRKTVVPSSAILMFLFLSWLLLLQVPRIIRMPSHELLWSGAAQLVSLVAGGWVLFASLASPTEGVGRWFRGDRGVRVARWMYAVALPMFGLHHFFDAPGAAEAVPAWLPFPLGWAYLTGAGHVAAGVAILLGIVPRLGATLEAIMISAFVLLIHVPGVVGAPKDGLQWTMFVAAAAIGGAAWIVARSYAGGAAFGEPADP